MILSFRDLHRTGAILIIVRHTIDPRAYGVAKHQAGIVGLQQCRDNLNIIHTRIEPEIVRIRM